MLPIAGILHLSTSEAAAQLNVSDSRVRQLVMERRLRPRRLGARNFFDPRQVEAIRLEMEAAHNAPPKPRIHYPYKPVPPTRRKSYKRPIERQEERRKRLIRVRVSELRVGVP
jgi:excisionase family DNA binding protein